MLSDRQHFAYLSEDVTSSLKASLWRQQTAVLGKKYPLSLHWDWIKYKDEKQNKKVTKWAYILGEN